MKKIIAVFYLALGLVSVNAEDTFGDKLSAPAKVQIINKLPEGNFEEPEMPYIYVMGVGTGETKYIWESIERNGTVDVLSAHSKIICLNENLLFVLELQANHDYIIRIEKTENDFISNVIDTTVTKIYVIQNKILVSSYIFPYIQHHHFYGRYYFHSPPRRVINPVRPVPPNRGPIGGNRPHNPPSSPKGGGETRPPSPPDNRERGGSNRPPGPPDNRERGGDNRPPGPPDNRERGGGNRPPGPPDNRERSGGNRPPSPPDNRERGGGETRPPGPPDNRERGGGNRPPSPPDERERGGGNRPSNPPANSGRGRGPGR